MRASSWSLFANWRCSSAWSMNASPMPRLLRHFLFEDRKAHAIVAEWEGQPAGFALYFYNFSTFIGRPGLYLEDLFVRPAFRRNGIAQAIFRWLAKKAVAEGCGRFEWSVLDWNENAIAFYRSR